MSFQNSMKSALKILCFLFLFSAIAHQKTSAAESEKQVTVRSSDKTLAAVLSEITHQTGIRFSYNPQTIDTKTVVTCNIEKKSLEETLQLILPQTIQFRQLGTHIVLAPASGKKPAQADTEIPESGESNEIKIIEETENREEIIADNDLNIRNDIFFLEKISPLHTGIEVDKCHSCVNSKNDEEMRKSIAAMALLVATSATAGNVVENEKTAVTKAEKQYLAAPPAETEKPFQFTFVYPLGTDWVYASKNSYNFSFNLLGGITGRTTGFELGSCFNMNAYSSRGVQIAGAFNMTGTAGAYREESNNVQIAGAFNYTKAGNSFQLAGAGNMGNNTSAQIAGALNISQSAKVQLAGAANATQIGGVQIAGAANIAQESALQIAGALNITGKGGLQIGVVNIRDTDDGVSVGLINIVKQNGVMEFGLEGGEYVNAALTFRSGTQRLYSIIAGGYNFGDQLWAVGAGFGTGFKFGEKFGLNLEAVHYNLYDNDFKTEHYNGLTQFRPVVNFKIAEHFKIFAGPTFNLMIQSIHNDLDISIPYSIFENENKYSKLNGWVGFTAGIKF